MILLKIHSNKTFFYKNALNINTIRRTLRVHLTKFPFKVFQMKTFSLKVFLIKSLIKRFSQKHYK